MIDYDSFSRCHLTDIFFRFSRGSKRVKNLLLTPNMEDDFYFSQSKSLNCDYFIIN